MRLSSLFAFTIFVLVSQLAQAAQELRCNGHTTVGNFSTVTAFGYEKHVLPDGSYYINYVDQIVASNDSFVSNVVVYKYVKSGSPDLFRISINDLDFLDLKTRMSDLAVEGSMPKGKLRFINDSRAYSVECEIVKVP